ncbi:uncharacterized protein LOC142585863 [Dermacentor variabilis]|uniref:uncharacterized protein LOC142576661 n=1 Tax=Dermacentor variabilis TaxID=34621 RepID=UPI003F5B24D1
MPNAAEQKEKSRAVPDDVQDDVIWLFFDQMMFLRHTMESRPMSANLPPVPPPSEEGSAADILTKNVPVFRSGNTWKCHHRQVKSHKRQHRLCLRRRMSLWSLRAF